MTTDDFGPQVKFDVVKVKDGQREVHSQPVATEVPCTLVVNGQELATIMCTPSYLREFAVGYLFTSGVINEANFRCRRSSCSGLLRGRRLPVM